MTPSTKNMLWLVGLDEAGYGPNLGPLVQATCAARVPTDHGCLWNYLKEIVRRGSDAPDDRIAIDDSKIIYSGSAPFERLEQSLLRTVLAPQRLGQFLATTCDERQLGDLANESWYRPDDDCPMQERNVALDAPATFASIVQRQGIEFGQIRVAVTTTPRFNMLVDHFDSKAAALAEGVIDLIRQQLCTIPGDEPVSFVIDKQGGRNYYASLIQTALPDGWVVAERESNLESRYRVEGVGRQVRFVFRPKADQECLLVALASMVAKYLREVFMRQFNCYWQQFVPGLSPTAGYPTDAKRFYSEIRGTMASLNLGDDEVWRKR